MNPNLNESQFGEHGKYVLAPDPLWRTSITAYPKVQDESGNIVPPHLTNKRPVGRLTWFPGKPTEEDLAGKTLTNIQGGMIHKVVVKPAHQRKGIASAMLDHARDLYPEHHIRHSNALTEDGQAWVKAKP